MQLANSIDEVIETLDQIIVSESEANSNLAYFPVLYKRVTERIKSGIINREFENNTRMEKLDVIFANRYLQAYKELKAGSRPTNSWSWAFSSSKNSKFIIIQHLLLGINAHINLDLGIAASETVGEDGELQDLENDFNMINDILSSLVDTVQDQIGRVSPMFYLLEKIGKGKEDKIVTFSINVAREGAWLFANQYHFSTNKSQEIEDRDSLIKELAIGLTKTRSRMLRWVIRCIRLFETKKVSKAVAVLGE